MVGRQGGALAPAVPVLHDRRDWSGFLPLLMLYYMGIPIADVLAGALTTFLEIEGFAVAYKACVLLLLLLFLMAGKVRGGFGVLALATIGLLVMGAGVRQSLGMGGFKDDLLFIARGPILFSCALIVLMSLSGEELRRLASAYFVCTWLVMTGSIVITNGLGISLTTYDAGYGSKGFYQAANEVTLGYILSWWYIVTRFAPGRIYKIVVTIVTLYIIYTIGTKSGFVLMPLLLFWYLGKYLKISSRALLVIFLLSCYVVAVYAASIFLLILPFLPAAQAFDFFIATYGVETALTGGRFYQLDEIVAIISNFSWQETLFGIGFQNFWFAIDGTSVESDLIDIFGGGGLIFVCWFYGLLIWGYLLSKRRDLLGKTVDTEWAVVFLAVIMYSIFVGHVAFAATPLITVAIFTALAYKERGVERRHSSVLV
jgi:hypothetical protein